MRQERVSIVQGPEKTLPDGRLPSRLSYDPAGTSVFGEPRPQLITLWGGRELELLSTTGRMR